jgi:hypothetical protein
VEPLQLRAALIKRAAAEILPVQLQEIERDQGAPPHTLPSSASGRSPVGRPLGCCYPSGVCSHRRKQRCHFIPGGKHQQALTMRAENYGTAMGVHPCMTAAYADDGHALSFTGFVGGRAARRKPVQSNKFGSGRSRA